MGFASLLEDIEEKRSNPANKYKSWRRFFGPPAEKHVSPEPPRATRPRDDDDESWTSTKIPTAVGKPESLLAGQVDWKQLEELGESLQWPEHLRNIVNSYLSEQQRPRSAPAKRWSRFVEMTDKLDGILRAAPIGADAYEKESVIEVGTALSSILGEYPEFRTLSTSTFDSISRELKTIRRAAEVLRDDLALIENHFPTAQQQSGHFDSLIEIFTDLTEKRSKLTELLQQHDEFQNRMKRLQGNFTEFSRAHLHILRPCRPPISELSRMFLDEDQEHLVAMDHQGHFRLSGPSGSGKSIILIHRALRMASEGKKVRVLTLNRNLAAELQRAYDSLNALYNSAPIEILSIDDLYLDLANRFGKLTAHRSLDTVRTFVNGKPFAVKWQEFFGGTGNRPHRIFYQTGTGTGTGTGKQVTQNKQLWEHIRLAGGFRNPNDVSKYLYHEVKYIRSGFFPRTRNKYLKDTRIGRGLHKRGIHKRHRSVLLQATHLWDKFLDKNLLYDHESLAICAHEILAKKTYQPLFPEIRADCTLADEAQDMSTLDLDNLRLLSANPSATNALFFVGDFEQIVHGRHSHPPSAGLPFTGRSRRISRPYRNTVQIVRAARGILRTYSPPKFDSEDNNSFREPEWTGPKPLVVAASFDEQIDFAVEASARRAGRSVAVLAEDERYLSSAFELARAKNLRATFFLRNGEMDAPDIGLEEDGSSRGVVFARPASVKGHEFDTVIILGMSKGVIPPASMEKDEIWRYAATMYSALTRARDELFMFYSRLPSDFLTCMGDHVERHSIRPGETTFESVLSKVGSRVPTQH